MQKMTDGIVNIVHCCPEGTPEHVFRQLALADEGAQLLRRGAWIAVYGPYLADDGSYKSPGDEEVSLLGQRERVKADAQFDKSYIKANDQNLGLRTVDSITAYANKWGFEEIERKEMPKGNMWVVWRLVA